MVGVIQFYRFENLDLIITLFNETLEIHYSSAFGEIT